MGKMLTFEQFLQALIKSNPSNNVVTLCSTVCTNSFYHHQLGFKAVQSWGANTQPTFPHLINVA